MRRPFRTGWSRWRPRRPVSASRGEPAGPSPAAVEMAGALAAALDDAAVLTDPGLKVLVWNPALERITGVPAGAAQGRKLPDASPILAAAGIPRLLEQALDGPVNAVVEVPRPAGPGDPARRLAVRCLPLRGPDGTVAGLAAFLAPPASTQGRRFVEAVEAIGRALASSLVLDEVLDTIVRQATAVMAADAAVVVAWDGQAPHFTVLRRAGRLGPAYARDARIPVAGGPIARAVREVRVVTTPNILRDPQARLTPERRRVIEEEGFRAMAAAPLGSKGRVHGALVVHYWTEREFAPADAEALTLIAEHAALAIDNARLYAEVTRRADRLRELAEVQRLVTASLDLDDVLQRIATAAARLTGAPVVHLWTTDPAARTLRLRAASTDPALPPVAMPATMSFGEGITGLAAQRREPVFVADAAADGRVRIPEWAREAGLLAMLAVPVVAGDVLLGVVTLRARPGTLSPEEDRPLVSALAAQVAVAMQNARAYSEAVRRGGRLRGLAEVSQTIAASLDTAEVMRRIARAAAGLRPGALAAMHTLDPDRRVLRFAAFSSPELAALPDDLSVEHGLPGLVFEQRAPVLVPRPLEHPRRVATAFWETRPTASYYGVPILVGDSFMGVLDYIHPDGVPDAEEQEVLRLLAAHAGIAIRNASLYQGERSQAERIAALVAINQQISGALKADDLLRTIAEAAASLTGVRYALFWLADDGARTLTIKGGSVPGLAEDFPQPVVNYDFGGVGWVARHRTPLLIDDAFADPRIIHHDWWRRWGISSLAAFPILVGDELLAVLVLNDAQPVRFSEATREVIEMFIAQSAVAIQNARLYREAERRRVVAEALARLGGEITASLDVARIGELVARGLVELLGGRGSAVFQYDIAERFLRPIAVFGSHSRAPVLGAAWGEGVVGRAVAEGRMVSSADILEDAEIVLSFELRESCRVNGYRSVIAAPLLARGRVVGALFLGAEAGRAFSHDDRQVLQAFADQAALAFDNAQLYADARDSLARLRETQAQLVQAGKMSALGQLVSGVAHELNNPLSVIIGYGQLLLQRQPPEALRRPIEMMVSQGDRMARIIRSLLYFARQRQPERTAVDLHEVIEQTLGLRLHQLALANITVERDFAAELLPVTGDGQQLQQVFLNLLLNAEQAIAETGRPGTITFRTRLTDGGRRVQAQVEDDGSGIPPEILPRVFEPFFTTREVGTGAGLGLSVSYGIVEQHGGRLWAESQSGRTVFTLELPVGAPPVVTPAPAPRPAEGRAALVVEDEPEVAELIATLLRGAGWEVALAGGQQEALERLRARRYDLVVADLRMRDGSGEAVYRAATARDPSLAGRFLFITGDTGNLERWGFLREGELPVLEKPFARDAFLAAVRRVATGLTGSGPGA